MRFEGSGQLEATNGDHSDYSEATRSTGSDRHLLRASPAEEAVDIIPLNRVSGHRSTEGGCRDAQQHLGHSRQAPYTSAGGDCESSPNSRCEGKSVKAEEQPQVGQR